MSLLASLVDITYLRPSLCCLLQLVLGKGHYRLLQSLGIHACHGRVGGGASQNLHKERGGGSSVGWQ